MAVWELAYVAKKNNYIVQGGTGFVTCVGVLEALCLPLLSPIPPYPSLPII